MTSSGVYCPAFLPQNVTFVVKVYIALWHFLNIPKNHYEIYYELNFLLKAFLVARKRVSSDKLQISTSDSSHAPSTHLNKWHQRVAVCDCASSRRPPAAPLPILPPMRAWIIHWRIFWFIFMAAAASPAWMAALKALITLEHARQPPTHAHSHPRTSTHTHTHTHVHA